MPFVVTNAEISDKSRSRQTVLFVLVLVILLVAAWYLRHALLLIYVSVVFAVVLKPAVDWVHRRSLFGWRPGRGSALLLLAAGAVAVMAVIGALAVPPIADDIGDFAGHLPEYLKRITAWVQSLPLLRRVDLGGLQSQMLSALGGLQHFVTSLATGVMNFLTLALLVGYLILDGGPLLDSLLSTVPQSRRGRLRETLRRAGVRMRGWLVGQSMLMLILGSSSAVAFGLMGIPYFLALGVFAGIANIVPLLGPLLTVIVAGLVAATTGVLWKVLGVGIFYFVYQQVENVFLSPQIMKSQVEISPVVVVLALVIGAELGGVMGALVAVPTAVLVIEVAGEYLVRDE